MLVAMRDTALQHGPTPRPEGHRGSFPNAYTIFHVRGVPVRIDRSWLIIAGLVTWLFHSRLSSALPDTPAGVVVVSAVAAALLFFASLLAHELGHALTSLDRDIPVISITLFLMGGVTESTREARRARDEFIIVGIGPFISLVLAAAFGLLYAQVTPVQPFAAVLGYLAWTNLLLAIFNIVPGYPLDGGRLLRSILWAVTQRPHQATRWAARVGQAFALSLAGLGAWLLLGTNGGLGGLWELLIGFFLFKGATEAHQRARLQERLAGRTVGDLMGSVPPMLHPDMPLGLAIEQVQQRPSLPWPVGAGGAADQVLWLADIDAVPDHRWGTTTVGEVAGPAGPLVTAAGTTLDEALPQLAEVAGHMLLVVDGAGRPVGLLTPSLIDDVMLDPGRRRGRRVPGTPGA
jgi:Zn-dependent protease